MIAVYDKKNLFITERNIFTEADLEVVTFDTEFDRLGLMTSFDAMFAKPFLNLFNSEVILHIFN